MKAEIKTDYNAVHPLVGKDPQTLFENALNAFHALDLRDDGLSIKDFRTLKYVNEVRAAANDREAQDKLDTIGTLIGSPLDQSFTMEQAADFIARYDSNKDSILSHNEWFVAAKFYAFQ